MRMRNKLQLHFLFAVKKSKLKITDFVELHDCIKSNIFKIAEIKLQISNNSKISEDMPSKQKGSSKNGKESMRNKKVVNTTGNISSGSGTYLFFIGLSVVIATAAVILTFEDVQLYFVKLTKMGSNPLESILKAEELRQTTEDPKDVPDSKSNNEDDSSSENNENESDQGANRESESDQIKEPKDENKTEKKKNKRKDYAKNDITSKADYKVRSKLDAADKLLEEGDVEGAIQKFDKILQSHPNSPRALWGKGLATDKLAERKRSNSLLEEAIKLMDTALRVSDTPEKLLMQIATKLAQRQAFRGWSHKEAKTWQFLIQKFPDNMEYRKKLGVSYMMIGNIEEARKVFTGILQKSPGDGFGLVHLGFILKTTDLNYKEAIPMLQNGIDTKEEGTQDGRFFYHLGDAYLRVNQTDKARETYRRGADIGLFLSEYQRSLYNANTKITGRPWWTPEQTTYKRYLTMLENNWKIIRDEGLAQLDQKTGAFIPEEENLRETGDWKQFTLYQRGNKDENNCKRAPKTCALIDQIPEAKGCTRGQVKFSVMHPGVHVWPHTGPTNCRLRAHLGLKIPEGPRIRVGDEIRTWKEGKFIIIDDSFEHEVWHDGTELRLILIVDFWHPEIPQNERRSLSPI
ncbi:aspartyl/asparaginyl beta-hydroxylase-like [Ruditapes philippinarum]|uniref:aspartyl/asparaginyl beta-hydroxylase-like n=1 Tax=Ruditapes philippinarum TaxID=129788 RepID=UPI00295BF286|nr:aspartyl/asparaginyl beta-hydroxylase-like [Ruditapes philippinarum]